MQTIDAPHRIATRQEWLAARRTLLERERELTRLRDQISRERQELPWEPVDKQYTFAGPDGQQTLVSLFSGRSQLIVYHFMFAPGWTEGCVGCSLMADHFDGAMQHVEQRDATFVAISRAPYAEFQPFRKRMGWKFKWLSSYGTDFNRDFGVTFTADEARSGGAPYNYGTSPLFGDEMPGISIFAKDAAGNVYHTWSGYARGLEDLLGAYRFMDLLPKGRNETGPTKSMVDWVRHHDRYGTAGEVDSPGRFRPAQDHKPCCHEAEAIA